MWHNSTQTGACIAYTNFHNDTPSLPRSITKAVFAKDSLRAATPAAHRGWSVGSQAKSLAARSFPHAGDVDDFLADGYRVALASPQSCKFHFDSGHHCWCERCLRHAHLSSISNALNRNAIRLHLPNQSLARALLVPMTTCTCAIVLVVGIRGSHLRLPPAWRASAAKYAWRFFRSDFSERVAHPSSKPAQPRSSSVSFGNSRLCLSVHAQSSFSQLLDGSVAV